MADNRPSAASRIIRWIDYRLPFVQFLNPERNEYPTPRNLSYWWNYGSLSGIMLVVMIVTGIFLAMQYTPSADLAFDSVERIMRDVNYGWLLRYAHMNGASIFFAIVYIHLFPRLFYGSPRTALDSRRHHPAAADRHSVYGIRPALGADELLGGHGHHQPVFGNSTDRTEHRNLLVGRLCRWRPDYAPLLCASLPAAVRDCCCGAVGFGRAAPPWLQQPARDRSQRGAGHDPI